VAEAALLTGLKVRDSFAMETFMTKLEDKVSLADNLAALEARATANGYPPGWLAPSGSLAGEETFTAPARFSARPPEGEV
jgi:hypothetical protein